MCSAVWFLRCSPSSFPIWATLPLYVFFVFFAHSHYLSWLFILLLPSSASVFLSILLLSSAVVGFMHESACCRRLTGVMPPKRSTPPKRFTRGGVTVGGPTFEERIARLKSEGSKMGSMDLEAELQVLLEEHMALRSALDDVPLLKDISPGSPRRARSPDRIAQAFVSLDKTLLGISAILQRPVSSASSQRTRPVTDILDRSEQVVITKSVPYVGGVATFLNMWWIRRWRYDRTSKRR